MFKYFCRMYSRILLLSSVLNGCWGFTKPEEDAVLRSPELIKKYGYPVEIHEVTTEDGYSLSHHRIPRGRFDRNTTKPGPPIILQHGLLGSSSDWLLKAHDSLAYILADAGYDVWLMNNRGNEYCEKHRTLNPKRDRRSFWDFSWHEIGVYDLPNTIDYILNKTDEDKLFHIGHSQGCTVVYVLLSERPEYNEKIKAHISYSPIAFHKHTISILFRALAPIEAIGGLAALKTFLGEFNFAPSTSLLRYMASSACNDRDMTQVLCSSMYYMVMGYNPSQMNTTMLPIIYGHFPAGSSMMQVAHYIQGMNSGKFRKFDYSFFDNLVKYNRIFPPEYKLENVRIPTYTFYGGKDAFAQMPDVEKLHRLLPNLIEKNYIADWAHMDFLFGIDAVDVIYVRTLEILKESPYE